MRIAFIDHFDSFSFNIIELLREFLPGLDVWYIRADDVLAHQQLRRSPVPTVISPGPGKPEEQSMTLATITSLIDRVPILGVCLGHQMLGLMAGGSIRHSAAPMHGKLRMIETVRPHRVLDGISACFEAACYNSLAVFGPLAHGWSELARDRGAEIQILVREPAKWLTIGIQFHPESHLANTADSLIKNWLTDAMLWTRQSRQPDTALADALVAHDLNLFGFGEALT